MSRLVNCNKTRIYCSLSSQVSEAMSFEKKVIQNLELKGYLENEN